MKDMRLGSFRIGKNFIDDNPELVRQVMGRMIIVRAEYMFGSYINYTALSPEFDKVGEGYKAPEYEVIITNKMKGKKQVLDKITFKRRK